MASSGIETTCVSAKDVLDQMPDPRWVRSYYSDAEGEIYRDYESTSVDLIFEHARRAGMAIDKAGIVREP